MAISHVKSNTVADFTGTVTVFNSAGATTTVAATDLVRPGDWNSAHYQHVGLVGNTAGTASATATNLAYGGTNNVTMSLSTDAANAATLYVSGPPVQTVSEFWNPPTGPYQANVNSLPGNYSLSIFPVTVNNPVSASQIELFASVSLGTQTNTSSAYLRASFIGGIYSLSASSKLASLNTTTATSVTTWASNTGGYTRATGNRIISFPWDVYLTQGVYYFGLGLAFSNNATNTSTATTGLGNTLSMYGMMTRSSEMASAFFGCIPFGTAIANSNSVNPARFFGYYSATTRTAPDTIGSDQVWNSATAPLRAGVIVRLRNV